MAYFASAVSLTLSLSSRTRNSVCDWLRPSPTSYVPNKAELARRAVDLARPLPSMRHPRRPHKHPESPPLVSLRHRLSSEEKVKKVKL